MHFQELKEILNQKLTEIWAFRRYTIQEEMMCDNKAKKIHFIKKIDSHAVFAEEYTVWSKLFISKESIMTFIIFCRYYENVIFNIYFLSIFIYFLFYKHHTTGFIK